MYPNYVFVYSYNTQQTIDETIELDYLMIIVVKTLVPIKLE